MCIIAIKEKGVDFPSIERVKNMCDNNPHGFSLIFQSGNQKPFIYRTLNQDKMMKKYVELINNHDANDTSVVIHTRIMTHGVVNVANCHGWKSDGLIFGHNGILSVEPRDGMTDSETFFRDLFIPAYRCGGWEMGERAISAIIGTSKFFFMDNYGNIRHFGTYIEGDDGILYSNSTYLPKYQPRYRWGGMPFQRTISCGKEDDTTDFDYLF